MNPVYFPDIVGFWDAIFGVGSQIDVERPKYPPDSWYDIVVQLSMSRIWRQG